MFETTSKLRPSSVMRAVAAVGLLISVTACGSLGGSSKETPPPPTATVWATQQSEASATAAATPESFPTMESTPVTVASPVASATATVTAASPAASPAATVTATLAVTPAGATPNVQSVLTDILAGMPSTSAATPVAGASTPSQMATPSASTPVAALTVTSCEPNEVPQFTGTKPDYVVKEDVNFRVGPGSDCDVIGDPLSQGVRLTVISDPVVREGDPARWVKVNVDGQIGWVALEFIEPYQP